LGLFYLGQFLYKNILWSDKRADFTRSLTIEKQKILKSIRDGSASESQLAEASSVLEENTAVKALQRLRAIKTSEAQSVPLDIEAQFELIIDTIRTIRNLRQEANIKPGLPIAAVLQSDSDRERQSLTNGQDYIKDLAKVSDLTGGRRSEANDGRGYGHGTGVDPLGWGD
jgi:CheY-like chemotaxis protein